MLKIQGTWNCSEIAKCSFFLNSNRIFLFHKNLVPELPLIMKLLRNYIISDQCKVDVDFYLDHGASCHAEPSALHHLPSLIKVIFHFYERMNNQI